MTEPGKIQYREIEKPKPSRDEVVITVKRIGICGSDIHVFHGQQPLTVYPVVQGHEVSGIVESVGLNVTEFMPGDKVTFIPQITCGECYACKLGSYNICERLKVMGFQVEGAAQEFFLVHSSKVLKLPEKLTFDEAAMIEPVAVAVHAVGKVGSISNKKVVVLGAGPIGNLVAQVAIAKGADSVMITDISNFRLEIAKQCGVTLAFNPKTEDIGNAINIHFGSDRADFIFECVGAEATLNHAIELARKGSVIVVVGVFGEMPQVNMFPIQDGELNVIGSLMYLYEDYEKAITLLEKGNLTLQPLISASFPLSSYHKAFAYINKYKQSIMKIMISVDS